MKKILIVVMMCMMSAVTFANTKEHKRNQLKSEIKITSTNINFMFCQVTVNIHWYNSYGAYVGTTSGTSSVNGQFGCTLAYMMAKNIAERNAPAAIELIEEEPELKAIPVPVEEVP